MHRLTRRDLLRRAAGAGVVAAGALSGGAGATAVGMILRPGVAAAAAPFSRPLVFPPTLTDADITLTAAPADVQILEGAATRMWTFNGTFPGPTIRRPSGTATRVTVVHQLPASAESLTIHHHGAHSAPEHDGLPQDVVPGNAIEPGASRTYVYEHQEDGGPERAAMQWYHDHSHHRTSINSWMGLGGLFILDDAVEAALPLPRGSYELPLFLTDRAFDESNQLQMALFSSPPANREVRGTTLLVNGTHEPYADVEPRRYRVRVHNGAGFSLYNLTAVVTDGTDITAVQNATGAPVPLVQIGTESGLLPAPVTRDAVLLGPAERADIVIDFAPYAGKRILLASVGRVSRPVTGATRVPTDGDVPNGGVFLQFRVGTTVTEADPGPVPASLRPLPDWVAGAPDQPDRVWVFGRGVNSENPQQMPHSVNGRPFDHQRVDAEPELGATESWLLVNASDRTHYIHLHDVDWYVVSRNGAAPPSHEAGLKETFKLDPGEIVLLATRFTDHLGPYMIHCHMLDHEDSGMMARFDVVAPGAGSATTLTLDEQRRTDAILAAVRRNPGAPAPGVLLANLERDVVITESGSPYRCTLV